MTARCQATDAHPITAPVALMQMAGGTALCGPCILVQVRVACVAGREIHFTPVPTATASAASKDVEAAR